MHTHTARTNRIATVLVADDDEAVRDAVSMVLKAAGYDVLAAADGEEALQQFQQGCVDLLILDLGLPLKSGWEVFERIATDHPAVPIIIITGMSNQQFSALAAGASVLMEKPLDVVSLLRCIKELLEEPVEKRLSRIQGQGRDFRRVPPTPWFTGGNPTRATS